MVCVIEEQKKSSGVCLGWNWNREVCCITQKNAWIYAHTVTHMQAWCVDQALWSWAPILICVFISVHISCSQTHSLRFECTPLKSKGNWEFLNFLCSLSWQSSHYSRNIKGSPFCSDSYSANLLGPIIYRETWTEVSEAGQCCLVM